MPSRRFDQPGFPPATITEFEGVRSLHLGTSWVQGAMRIARPDVIELEYVRMMMIWTLFLPAPRHIVQLGLGSAALTKFSYRQFPKARVTAIELNPNVIAMCEEKFGLPPNDARLDVRPAGPACRGCEARGRSPRGPVPSGRASGRGEDRTGERE